MITLSALPCTRTWAVNTVSLPVDNPRPTEIPPLSPLFHRKQLTGDGTWMPFLLNVLYSLLARVPPRVSWLGREEEAVRGSIRDRKRHFYILSAGGTLPRRLGVAPCPTHPSRRATEYDVPVAHRGILHWLALHPEASSTAKMLAFDTVSETFRLMSRPPEQQAAGDTTTTRQQLLELDGELSVVAMQGVTSLAIWALQDYEAEVWTLRCRVEVPPSTLFGGISNNVMPSMVLSVGAGAILIGDRYCDVARLYDLKDKRMRSQNYLGGQDPMFLALRGSIMPHAFFGSPRSSEVAHIKFFG